MSCPYERDCFVIDDDFRQISGACESGAYGAKCGPAVAYKMLVEMFGRLERLDSLEPIIGNFTVLETPDGVTPEDIRKQWVNVEMPLRKGYDANPVGIEVVPADAVAALYAHGKIEAAKWFLDAGLQIEPLGGRWVFQGHEGAVVEDAESTKSLDYFGQFVNDGVKRALHSIYN